ncbi:unnamed protein product [Arabis nemorensis]|uniref:Uncharacterized protein n=1 Tax=Arabis nemorensis TaxID=586526 RepID=A0A565CV36_9BRAS|nr:unnamed protein product [Arabis nemorensis]
MASSQWTIPKLVTWRVKDWASCFLASNSVSPTSASQNRRLSWPQPPVSDEAGFIVFCFDREDGGFDVVKEEKQKKKEVELSPEKSPRTVNRKLIYGDKGVGGIEKKSSPEVKETEQDQNDNTSCQENEDATSNVHEVILGVEWMGSPVQMPKSDDLSPKKQKPIALGFQCCRF